MAQSGETQGTRSGFVTRDARAAWKDWASARAQATFQRGNDAWQAGREAEAWDWLERANRQARDNPHIMFALALARQAVGDVVGAIALLNDLLKKFEFREGWILLATFQQSIGNGSAAVSALGRVLSHFACTAEIVNLAETITQLNGLASWCGVQGDGLLVLGEQVLP